MALLTTSPVWQPPSAGTVPVQGYRIVRAYPHDPDAFTQGLEYVDGMTASLTTSVVRSTCIGLH